MQPNDFVDIPGYEGLYQINQLGQVKSVRAGRLLTPMMCGAKGKQYATVRLWVSGKYKDRKVHQLVLEVFVGPRPTGTVGRHLNDDQTDNRLDNLCWGTYTDNVKDMVRNGHNRHHKLTAEQRAEIFRRRMAGEPCRVLAEEFGVNRHHISAIGIGRIKIGEL